MNQKSLYERLGGYDGIATFVNNLLPRLQTDSQLGRFYQNRGEDGVAREKQLTIDFFCSSTGGPVNYNGRNMKQAHKGMKLSQNDWSIFLQLIDATIEALQIPRQESDEVVSLMSGLKEDIVET
jgi:hemoglobin